MEILAGTRDGLWVKKGKGFARLSPSGWAVTDVVMMDGDVLVGRRGGDPVRLKNGEWITLDLPQVTAWGYHRETPDIVWAGSVPAALWVSQDNGMSWEECKSVYRLEGYDSWWVVEPPHCPAVLDIDFSPRSVGMVYAAVEDAGVLRTRDGGKRWHQLEGGIYSTVHTLVAHPRERGVIFAATESGFFRTDDGGFYWHRLVDGMRRLHLIPAILLPGSTRDGDVLLTAGAIAPEFFWNQPEGARCVVYRSDDWGESWYAVSKGLGIDLKEMITAFASTGDTVIAGSSGGHLWKSEDRGESWEMVGKGLPFVTSLAVLPAE